MSRRTVLLAFTLAACQHHTFNCVEDADCVNAGEPGRCERDGFCSFPDVACASGSRYSTLSPRELAGTCVAQPANDTCAAAAPLVLGEPSQGDLRGAAVAPDLLACSPQVTGDAFYTLELAECSDLTVHAEAAGGNLAVGLVRGCEEQVGCADASQTFAPEDLALHGVPAGTYQVGVGGVFYDGSFSVTASIADPPANDTAASPLDLVLTSTTLSLVTTQSLARAGDQLACTGRGGARDLFYQLSMPDVTATERHWVVDVGVTGEASDDFAVALDPGAQPACLPMTSGPVRFYDVASGSTPLLAVDGPADASCGHFDLDVRAKEVQDNNRCGGPPVGLSDLRTLNGGLSGDLGRATDEYRGSCATGDGNDVAYAVSIPVRGRYRIRAHEQNGGFTPIVYVRPAGVCGGDDLVQHVPKCGLLPADDGFTDEKACAIDPASSTADLVATLDAANYEIIVDSQDGDGGYILDMDRLTDGDTPPGIQACGETDCCETGSTAGADSTRTTACDPSAPFGDVFYTFALPACDFAQKSDVRVRSLTPQWVTATVVCDLVQTPNFDCTAPSLVNGVWQTVSKFQVNNTAGNCVLSVRVAASTADPDDKRGGFVLRLEPGPNTACPAT